MGSYRATIVERHRLSQELRRSDMRAEASRLANEMASRFLFRRLYLFGSVADGRPLSVWSDMDLAVEGLPPGRFLELAGALAAASSHTVDLKPLEELAADQRRRIALEGVLIYERD